MKTNIYIFILVLIFSPVVIYMSLLLIRILSSNDRKFVANFDRVGWSIEMKEQKQDSLLLFTLYQAGKIKSDSISFDIHNNYCTDVISLLFVEGVDTVYIRKGREFKDLFSLEEQSSNSMAPKDFPVNNPFIGELPPKCKIVAFSDSSFFIYDKNKCTYIPKDDITHVITLFHNTERGDYYTLYDVIRTDTLEIKIIQKQ